MFMKVVILIYFVSAILAWSFKTLRKRGIGEWVPKEFRTELKGCSPGKDTCFQKGNEIPSDSPTILIIGKIKTTNKTIILLDILANFLTFGFLRLDEIIPVGEPAKLRLYFKNISIIPASIQGGVTDFYIKYPGSEKPDRKWEMKIPDLTNFGDGCFIESKKFFSPELPGAHELFIGGSEGIVVAGPFGVGDRKYRIPIPGAPWKLLFHVSSGYEYKTFLVALCALVVSIISMAVSVIGN
jgi:hypothetical protein